MFQRNRGDTVGGRLRSRRELAGLTQETLAERLHVTRQTISNWEGGKSLPDIESLKALAAALNVPIEQLIYEQPPPIPDSGRLTPSMAEWCRWLGVLALAVGGLWGLYGAQFQGLVWSFSVWGRAIIRGTILLGISRILTLTENREP